MSRKRMLIPVIGALALGLLTLEPALAAGGGGGLPWEGPLQQIQESIFGSVAGFIALAAVAVAGGMLIFGGELNDFARRLTYVVLVAGILPGATQIVALFGERRLDRGRRRYEGSQGRGFGMWLTPAHTCGATASTAPCPGRTS